MSDETSTTGPEASSTPPRTDTDTTGAPPAVTVVAEEPPSLAARRRHRSRRALVAVGLLVLAAAGVAAAAAVASLEWVTAAAVGAVLLGAVAARVVWAEVRVTRRWAAYDRARQIESHAAESSARSADHTEVLDALGDRLSRSRHDADELRVALAATAEQVREAEAEAAAGRARQALADRESARLRQRLAAVQERLAEVVVTVPATGTGAADGRPAEGGQAPPVGGEVPSQRLGAGAGEAGTTTATRMLLEGQVAELREEVERVRESLADARRVAVTQRQHADALRAEVAALQEALTEQQAEESDELASWEGPDPDGVVRLSTWNDRRQA